MKHHNHWSYTRVARQLDKRAQAALDYLICLVIGCGLAAALVAWWSS